MTLVVIGSQIRGREVSRCAFYQPESLVPTLQCMKLRLQRCSGGLCCSMLVTESVMHREYSVPIYASIWDRKTLCVRVENTTAWLMDRKAKWLRAHNLVKVIET